MSDEGAKWEIRKLLYVGDILLIVESKSKLQLLSDEFGKFLNEISLKKK